MSVMAAAIVGSAVVTGYATSKSAKGASKNVAEGADTAAQAQIESTRMQVEEISRQFDYQQEILQPQIQQQFNAQRAYSDLLGIGGPSMTTAQARGIQNPDTGYVSTARPQAEQDRLRDREIRQYQDFVDQGLITQAAADREIAAIRARPSDQERLDQTRAGRRELGKPSQDVRAQMGGPGSSGVGRPRGGRGDYFQDPNLDPTRLADTSLVDETVQRTLQAGTSAEDDPFRNFIQDSNLAAEDLSGDILRQDIAGRQLQEGAAGTGVYGDVFTESPGYAFQVEEMDRATDRIGSAGGPNIGGRAIMEAQRRAKGLAAGEYYNWAQGRTSDLQRRGQAEATDAARLDRAGEGYRQQQTTEQQRGDIGYQNYLQRRDTDAGREINAAQYADQLEATDRQRTDQGYYNYLDSLARQAGFGGGSAAQAVSASQTQGQQVAGAVGRQGSALSAIALNAGNNQAQIEANKYAGYNNALQGGIQNYMTYQSAQPPPPPTTTRPNYLQYAGTSAGR